MFVPGLVADDCGPTRSGAVRCARDGVLREGCRGRRRIDRPRGVAEGGNTCVVQLNVAMTCTSAGRERAPDPERTRSPVMTQACRRNG